LASPGTRTAWDLDGVLLGDTFGEVLLPALGDVTGRSFSRSQLTDVHDLPSSLGVTREQVREAWYHPSVMDAILTVRVPEEALVALRSSRKPVIITARWLVDNGLHPSMSHADRAAEVKRRTLLRLETLGLSGIEVVASADKVGPALERGVVTFYEDDPRNVMELASAGIRVRMPLHPYNAHVRHALVETVDWY